MFSPKALHFTLLSALALSVAGCGTQVRQEIETRGQYWQRVEASSALYIQGAKAQELLNRDISRCVHEVRELVRLGQVKQAIPGNPENFRPGVAESKLDDWNTPERDGVMLMEEKNFNDFDSCMYSMGWERVKYVPYDVAKYARDAYMENHVVFKDVYKKRGMPETYVETHPGDYND